jgi:hypothetical protein
MLYLVVCNLLVFVQVDLDNFVIMR